MDLSPLNTELLIYAKAFLDTQAAYQWVDDNPDKISDIPFDFDELEAFLMERREEISSLGGYVINVAILKQVRASEFLDLAGRIKGIQAAMDLRFPLSTKIRLEAFEETDLLELLISTDRKILVPVVNSINAMTDGRFELSPFQHRPLKPEHQDIRKISTGPEAAIWIKQCAEKVPAYKHLTEGFPPGLVEDD